MPILKLETNVPAAKLPSNLLPELCRFVAHILGKPENYSAITIVPDQLMILRGSTDPCVIGTLVAMGDLNTEKNIALSKALFEKLHPLLEISLDRMYILFHDEIPSNVGHNGTTYHEILAKSG